MPEPARPCPPSLSRPPAGRVSVQTIRHAPTTDVPCTGMSPLQAPLPAIRGLDARFKERYDTMRSIQKCTINETSALHAPAPAIVRCVRDGPRREAPGGP